MTKQSVNAHNKITADENLLAESPAEMVKRFPHAPGVYLMKDAADRVIYIGKAKDLRNRASSYFHKAAAEDPRTAPLIPEIHHCEYLQTASEVDAILLEAKLVKELQPKFNRDLKDDKSFPFLQITVREPFPRVMITRNPKRRGVKLFGPFTQSSALRGALLALQNVFQFRTCTHDIDPNNPRWKWFRPCLLHSVKRCSAPCNLRITPEEYKQSIQRLVAFLRGKRSSILKEIEREMNDAAASRRYEDAARLRDQLRDLKRLKDRGCAAAHLRPEQFQLDPRQGVASLQELLKLSSPPRTIEGIDIAHLAGSDTVGSLVQFIDGMPFKNGYRRYKIRTVDGISDVASIAEVVLRRFGDADASVPDLLLIDGGAAQLGAALGALSRCPVRPQTVISLAKKEEEIFVAVGDEPLRLSRRSAALRLLQYIRDEAHRFAQHYHHLLRQKRIP
ncbi:MAG: UvrB/UvrC motif-containing protein [Thermoguttaceae bacterium]